MNHTCLSSLHIKGEDKYGSAGLVGEKGMEAVLHYTFVSVQTHQAEKLLQAALGVSGCREAARFGGGG